MGELEELKKQLKGLQEERLKAEEVRKEKDQIKRLKAQIKAEKFAQTKGGKIFNKIADIGDAGLRATKKFLSAPPQQQQMQKGKAKKKTPVRLSVEEVMARLPA